MATIEIDYRIATAVHEVGHTLLRALGGFKITSISIQRAWFSGGQWSGMVCCDLMNGYGNNVELIVSDEDLKLYCLGCVAGQEAESLWLSHTYGMSLSEARAETLPTASIDMRNFKSAAVAITDEEFTLMGARREVDVILLRHWPVIQLLSDTLSEQQSLKPSKAHNTVRAGSDPQVHQFNPTVVPRVK